MSILFTIFYVLGYCEVFFFECLFYSLFFMCLVTSKCFFLVSILFTIFYVLGYCEVFFFLSVYFIRYFLYAWLLRSVFF